MQPAHYPDKRCLLQPVAVVMLLLSCSAELFAENIIGWVEHVRLTPGNAVIAAKIDTGADTSSLHCDCQPPYLLNGKQHIRFSTMDVNGKLVNFDQPVVRTAKIKRHSGESQSRYVVRMGVCIGTQYALTEFSLVDRSGFNYNMLIGRNFLAGRFMVDASQQHTLKPGCEIKNQ